MLAFVSKVGGAKLYFHCVSRRKYYAVSKEGGVKLFNLFAKLTFIEKINEGGARFDFFY